MDTFGNNPSHGVLPAFVALALAGAIVTITIARQQMITDGLVSSSRLTPVATMPASPMPAAAPASPVAAPVQPFSREGEVLRIRAKGMPRALAAEHLARLTRARIVAGAQWLALAPALDLDWQGSDPAEAWKRVLGSGLRHTVICNDGGCTVRILSVDVDGGGVMVPEPAQHSNAGLPAETAGLMNQPTPPDAIDESALAP